MPVGSINLAIVHVFQYNARHQHAQQQEQKNGGWRTKVKQSELLELVKLNLLWELAPRHYQLPWMSMENIAENWVDCQMEA